MNGVLQERADALDLDIDRAKDHRFPADIDPIAKRNLHLQRQSVSQVKVYRRRREISCLTF